jgi:UDP-N-acetylglucosamine 2-epimerase (non-hydrolysing)
MSIVGVRPNFVKLAALNDLLSEKNEHVIVHTGQHYDFELSKAFLNV